MCTIRPNFIYQILAHYPVQILHAYVVMSGNLKVTSPARYTILYVKLLKGNVHRHISWNRNHINTVCVAWIVVWISRAFQCVVNYFATSCQKKIILHSDSLHQRITMVQDVVQRFNLLNKTNSNNNKNNTKRTSTKIFICNTQTKKRIKFHFVAMSRRCHYSGEIFNL